MNLALFSMVMDIVIVVLLVGTIYFAYALSKQLRVFRQSRAEFESLLMQLTKQINTANDAIDHMQESADTYGQKLDRLIHEGQTLADELKMINDTSNSLANRLEGAASTARKQKPISSAAEMSVDDMPSARSNAADDDSFGGFAIRDREADDDGADMAFADEAEDEDLGNFHSQAERELFTALKRKG